MLQIIRTYRLKLEKQNLILEKSVKASYENCTSYVVLWSVTLS